MIMNSELEEILERYPIVKEGLWRVYGIRVAHDMLLDQPEYQVHGMCIYTYIHIYI